MGEHGEIGNSNKTSSHRQYKRVSRRGPHITGVEKGYAFMLCNSLSGAETDYAMLQGCQHHCISCEVIQHAHTQTSSVCLF